MIVAFPGHKHLFFIQTRKHPCCSENSLDITDIFLDSICWDCYGLTNFLGACFNCNVSRSVNYYMDLTRVNCEQQRQTPTRDEAQMSLSTFSKTSPTGLDKHNVKHKKCEYVLTHKFKHMLWVLKRTVSLKRFF